MRGARRRARRRGLTTVEYVVVLVLVAVVAIVTWRAFGRRVASMTDFATSRLDDLAQGGPEGSTPGSPAASSGPGAAKPPGSGASGAAPTPAPAPGASPPPPPPPVINPASLPATGNAAPSTVTYPASVNQSMHTSYSNSFPGGKSQERGGTLVRGADGQVRVVNESSGTTGTFSPNRSIGPTDQMMGTYHTHPYDPSEGGHQGVSFSGADIAYAAAHKEPIIVDAGNKQFMITPTQATTGTSASINSDWNAEFSKQLNAGASMQDASAAASKAVAKKYDMAYYEGKNGTFTRVTP